MIKVSIIGNSNGIEKSRITRLTLTVISAVASCPRTIVALVLSFSASQPEGEDIAFDPLGL